MRLKRRLYEMAMWRLLAPILVRRIMHEARRRSAGLEGVDDALDFVWSFRYMGRSILPY
jgi:hypothetical protein